MFYRFLVILLCFVISNELDAQTSLLNEKWVGVGGVYLDSATIFKSSVRIINTKPSNLQLHFRLDDGNVLFLLNENDEVITDTFIKALIEYRTYPEDFTQNRSNRSQDIYKEGGYGLDHSNDQFLLEIEEKQKREELFSAPNIEKSGSLSRGLSMGNSQDVFVNSAMNLQLKGNITDDVQLTAILNDQDVPFQPEGNTQQIQDFDKVYIELKHKNAALAAGDIVMKNDPGVFLRYHKNVQGGQAKVLLGTDSSRLKSMTKGGGSIAKGQFYSADILPIDGVLGPYRLLGPNGENNIIVIANSEKVYLDGVLLVRGFDGDYVIDYNTSEVTFTEKIIISQYSRIRIDYEYATQYYSRTISEFSHQMTSKKWGAYFNFYQEKDDPNSSLFYSLSEEDKQILAGLGDSLQYAYAPSIDTVPLFDPNRVLYTEADTLTLEGLNTRCLRRATINDLVFYSAGFTDVGEGAGDYILDEVTAFGRYYKWVSPENGQRKGRYLPVRKLVAPNSKQMMTLGGRYQLSKFENVAIEGAFSNDNLNLFSDKDNNDNQGGAYSISFTSEKRPINEKLTISSHLALMQLDKNFKAIDRFRSIEFDRNWALDYQNLPDENELYFDGGITVADKKKRFISYNYKHRNRENVIDGLQQEGELKYNFNKVNIKGSFFNMNSSLLEDHQTAEWNRYQGEVFYNADLFKPGYKYVSDKQKTYNNSNDSIAYSWMNYEEHKGYIKNGDSLKWDYQLSYSHREDKAPVNGIMELRTISNTYDLQVGKTGQKGNIQIGATYRKWSDYYHSNPSNEETVQGRIVGGFKFAKGIGRFNGTYTVSSSRELFKEFVYIRVEDGKGTHTWRDLNGDGIKDQNEFFLAQNPDERQYARFYTPTDEYVPAYRSTLNLRLHLTPPKSWYKKAAFRKAISKFSNISSLLIDKKSLSDDVWGRYSPFPGSANKEDMLAYNYAFRNTLFFNRSNPIYGGDFRVVVLENTQLLTQGREERQDHRYTLGGRVNLKQLITLKLEGYQRDVISGSDYLDDRNYRISEYGIQPSLSFQPSLFMRYTLGYSWKNKQGVYVNELEDQKADNQEVYLEMKWSKASLFTITTKVSGVFQNYNGDPNSALGYEMLEALNEGMNVKWNIAWTQSLFEGMQLRVQYDGRKSETSDIIHIGSMNLTALF